MFKSHNVVWKLKPLLPQERVSEHHRLSLNRTMLYGNPCGDNCTSCNDCSLNRTMLYGNIENPIFIQEDDV